MSYLVFCVIDLKSASREDYLYAYMDLGELGLRRSAKSGQGPSFDLPGTTVMGMCEGRNAEEVRTLIGKGVRSIFKTRNLHGTFFVVVGGDWACTGDSL
jgi:hypothetical protein